MSFDPDWVVAPGAILADEMVERELTVFDVGEACGLSTETIQGVLDATVEITDEIAAGLAALGVSAQLWRNLERNYRDGLAAGKTAL